MLAHLRCARVTPQRCTPRSRRTLPRKTAVPSKERSLRRVGTLTPQVKKRFDAPFLSSTSSKSLITSTKTQIFQQQRNFGDYSTHQNQYLKPDLSADKVAKYTVFWNWMLENINRLADELQDIDRADKTSDEIQKHLMKISRHISIAILPISDRDPTAKELIISADRNLNHFSTVMGLVKVAPLNSFRARGWAVRAFKPRMYPEGKDSINFESIEIFFDEVLVTLSTHLLAQNAQIAPGFEFLNDLVQARVSVCVRGGSLKVSTEIEHLVVGMIESVIGEYDFAMHVTEVLFVEQFEEDEKPVLLTELPKIFDKMIEENSLDDTKNERQ